MPCSRNARCARPRRLQRLAQSTPGFKLKTLKETTASLKCLCGPTCGLSGPSGGLLAILGLKVSYCGLLSNRMILGQCLQFVCQHWTFALDNSGATATFFPCKATPTLGSRFVDLFFCFASQSVFVQKYGFTLFQI